MNVYLNRISGYADAIVCMYHSKRSWNRDLENNVYMLEAANTSRYGVLTSTTDDKIKNSFIDMLEKTCKIGKKHITLLRFIDLTFSVEGLHRGAQDDFDAHAKRLDNRIVRSSTRLSEFGNEKSEWYEDKIITLDEAIKILDIDLPDKVYKPTDNGYTFVKTVNGYIREDLADNKDAKRGLYMLSIPSNFTAKCNITEFAHIIKLRDKNSNASPELQEMIESLLTQIETACPLFTRDFFYSIEN